MYKVFVYFCQSANRRDDDTPDIMEDILSTFSLLQFHFYEGNTIKARIDAFSKHALLHVGLQLRLNGT